MGFCGVLDFCIYMVYNINIQGNEAEDVTLHTLMKTLRIIGWSILFAGLATAGVMCSNKGMNWWNSVSKMEAYQSLLKPDDGEYYSVQSDDKKDGLIFIIGQKVKPMIGGKVAPQGQLVTIEVPAAKGTGLMKGPFLTVNGGVTKYFLSESDVVQHALDN